MAWFVWWLFCPIDGIIGSFLFVSVCLCLCVCVVSFLGVVFLLSLWDCRVTFVICFVVVRPDSHLMMRPDCLSWDLSDETGVINVFGIMAWFVWWLFRPIDGIIGSFLFVSVCLCLLVCCIFPWCCFSPISLGLSCCVRHFLCGCASGFLPDDPPGLLVVGLKWWNRCYICVWYHGLICVVVIPHYWWYNW